MLHKTGSTSLDRNWENVCKNSFLSGKMCDLGNTPEEMKPLTTYSSATPLERNTRHWNDW